MTTTAKEEIQKYTGKKVYTDNSPDDWPKLSLVGWSKIKVEKSEETFFNGVEQYNALGARRDTLFKMYNAHPKSSRKDEEACARMMDEIVQIDHKMKTMFNH